MIIALTGSCCSSDCSTRNSLDRCRAAATDSLLPAAAEVVRPQAVLRLRPALTDSEAVCARDRPAWTLCESLPSGPLPFQLADTEELSLADRAMLVLAESVRPVVLV
jgi:hypothetical protein